MLDGLLVLASASPRRAELLRLAGYAFTVAPADLDETPEPGEAPAAYVRRLAEAKARAVAASRPGAVVLGADTTVVVDGDLLGKPVDDADAAAMLTRLQGRAHDVLTGVAVVGPAGRAERGGGDAGLVRVDVGQRDCRLCGLGGGARQGRRLRHPGAGVAVCDPDRRVVSERRRAAGGRRARPAGAVPAGAVRPRRRLTPEVGRHILSTSGRRRVVSGSH